jgi:DNA mismatch repair protein MutS
MSEKYLLASGEQQQRSDKQPLLSEKEIMNGVTAVITLMQLTREFLSTEAVNKNTAFSLECEAMLVY